MLLSVGTTGNTTGRDVASSNWVSEKAVRAGVWDCPKRDGGQLPPRPAVGRPSLGDARQRTVMRQLLAAEAIAGVRAYDCSADNSTPAPTSPTPTLRDPGSA